MSTPPSSSLAELAEDIEAFLPESPSSVRAELPDCVLVDAGGISYPPNFGAHRLRFDPERAEEQIESVRAWFRDRGRAEFTWWVGPSATPGDLESRLRAAGASPFTDEPVVAKMVRTEPPSEVDGIEVRRVERVEDFALAREMAWKAAGFTDEQLATVRATLAERWEQRQTAGNAATYLAFVDGEPIARGDVIFRKRSVPPRRGLAQISSGAGSPRILALRTSAR
jgi:hypothetical protein